MKSKRFLVFFCDQNFQWDRFNIMRDEGVRIRIYIYIPRMNLMILKRAPRERLNSYHRTDLSLVELLSIQTEREWIVLGFEF